MLESPNLYRGNTFGDPPKKEKIGKEEPKLGEGGKVKVEGCGYSHGFDDDLFEIMCFDYVSVV